MMKRGFMGAARAALFGAVAAVGLSLSPAPATATEVTVYKSPTCGCCAAWADHMRANGFQVTVVETDDLSETKERLGVPEAAQSCHTAVVAGYVVEGHVPAADVRRLLKEKPAARGLAVPGMPAGAPGMETGGRSEPYTVFLFDEAGQAKVFSRY